MIDLNQMVNQEIFIERLRARSELANEILNIIGCPQSPSEYIDKVREAEERLFKVREEYLKFKS